MKKTIISIAGIFFTIWAFGQTGCENCAKITDSFGVVLKTNDGICADHSGLPTLGDCSGMVSMMEKDTDADGVVDSKDKCPTIAGLASNKGCPDIDEESKTAVLEALNGVLFETGKTKITTDSYAKLDKVAAILQKHTEFDLSIEGHTDNVGDPKQNLKLSKGRSQACKDYLISKGVKSSRLKSEGYGETKPIASNDTEEGKSKNRRVEFNIIF